MKRSILMSSLALMIVVTSARAQNGSDLPGKLAARNPLQGDVEATMAPQSPQRRATLGFAQAEPPFLCEGPVCGPPGRVWAHADYLMWWIKGSPLPPLLTTSPPGTPVGIAGDLGQPATAILFGDRPVANEMRSGGRFTLGTWLDDQQTLGIEGNYFFLEQRGEQYRASSSGIPILARPFFDVTGPGQNVLLVAYPGIVAGTFHASLATAVHGGEVNLRRNLCCTCNGRLDLLGGYRFLSLNEDLEINEREISTNPNAPVPPGTFLDLFDGFSARNRFHGGQLGLAGEVRHGRYFVQGSAKVALGATVREVEISGFTRQVGTPLATGGFLASRTNIGAYESSPFSIVPELQLNLGYQLTDVVRIFAGYTFLYWTNVARAGQQIDLGVNPTQLPPGTLVGAPRPAFQFRDTDLWMHGVNFGIEIRF